MNTRTLVLAGLAAAALAVTGCGSQAASSSPPTVNPQTAFEEFSPGPKQPPGSPEPVAKHLFAPFEERAQQVQDALAPCATLQGDVCPEELLAMVDLAQAIGLFSQGHGYQEVVRQVDTIVEAERLYVDLGCAEGSPRPACAPAGSSLRLGWMTLKTIIDTTCVTETGVVDVCTLVDP